MGNRIIKESICTSDTIDKLSWFEEAFFYRLMVNCDDYGRMDARLPILKARLFPLKNVTEKQVEAALNMLRTVGIAEVYMYDDRPYLQLRTWERHQTIRNHKSKYPSPDESEIICMQLKSNENGCSPNPIQSNTNPNTNTNPKAHTRNDDSPFEIEIQNFIEHRKKLRKPMTAHAVELLRQKLDKLAQTEEEKTEILRQSIESGWQGVFELKNKASPKQDKPEDKWANVTETI